ncbi:MAG: SDR family oxidoreductase [Chitinophagaceae bacterium]|nr:MAG: SDR family oxidoreductase [Chitinophagaceae bacterium]
MDTSKYVLITGGSAGIGLEIAKLFADAGRNLIIVARDQAELADAKASLEKNGVSVVTISKDLFDPNASFELFEEIQSANYEVDTLVNNAGQGAYGLFKDNDIQKELGIIQLNISSLVVLTKLFLQPMLQRGEGKILNTSSVASQAPGPYHAVYHATKAFVQSFTEAIRNEVKDAGVKVTALLPGATDTGFFAKADMLDSKIVDSKLADPAQVAKDGYDALMSGDDKVVSGFMNKVQVTAGKVLSDPIKAAQLKKQQEPSK